MTKLIRRIQYIAAVETIRLYKEQLEVELTDVNKKITVIEENPDLKLSSLSKDSTLRDLYWEGVISTRLKNAIWTYSYNTFDIDHSFDNIKMSDIPFLSLSHFRNQRLVGNKIEEAAKKICVAFDIPIYESKEKYES